MAIAHVEDSLAGETGATARAKINLAIDKANLVDGKADQADLDVLDGRVDDIVDEFTPAGVAAKYEAVANVVRFTVGYRDKLVGIEAGARANMTGAEIAAAYEAYAAVERFTTSLKAKLDGIEAGATGDMTGAQIAAAYEAFGAVERFTTTLKAKLDGIEAGATGDMTAGEIRTALLSLSGVEMFTTAFRDKLTAIQAGATANDTDANLKNRANHTGSQAQSTITGLVSTIDALVAADAARATVTALAAETTARTNADTTEATTRGNADAVLANALDDEIAARTSADAAEATARAAGDTAARARSNHTGTQAIGTVASLQAALDAKATAAALATEVSDRAAADTAEAASRAAGDTSARARANHTGTQAIDSVDGLQSALNSKASTTALAAQAAATQAALETGLAALAPARPALYAARPALSPAYFTGALSGGVPTARPITTDTAVVQPVGAALRLPGIGLVAQRFYVPLYPILPLRGTASFLRLVDSGDPVNDAVRVGVAWYNSAMALIGTEGSQAVAETLTPVVADGLLTVEFAVGGPVDDMTALIPPNNAAYCAAFIRTVGTGATGVLHLSLERD